MSNQIDNLKNRLAQAVDAVGSTEMKPVPVRRASMFSLTASELLAACETNPKHPLAATFKKSATKQDPAKTVTVERADLEALLENKQVETSQSLEETEGVPFLVTRKTVVPETKVSTPTEPASAKSQATEAVAPTATPAKPKKEKPSGK